MDEASDFGCRVEQASDRQETNQLIDCLGIVTHSNIDETAFQNKADKLGKAFGVNPDILIDPKSYMLDEKVNVLNLVLRGSIDEESVDRIKDGIDDYLTVCVGILDYDTVEDELGGYTSMWIADISKFSRNLIQIHEDASLGEFANLIKKGVTIDSKDLLDICSVEPDLTDFISRVKEFEGEGFSRFLDDQADKERIRVASEILFGTQNLSTRTIKESCKYGQELDLVLVMVKEMTNEERVVLAGNLVTYASSIGLFEEVIKQDTEYGNDYRAIGSFLDRATYKQEAVVVLINTLSRNDKGKIDRELLRVLGEDNQVMYRYVNISKSEIDSLASEEERIFWEFYERYQSPQIRALLFEEQVEHSDLFVGASPDPELLFRIIELGVSGDWTLRGEICRELGGLSDEYFDSIASEYAYLLFFMKEAGESGDFSVIKDLSKIEVQEEILKVFREQFSSYSRFRDYLGDSPGKVDRALKMINLFKDYPLLTRFILNVYQISNGADSDDYKREGERRSREVRNSIERRKGGEGSLRKLLVAEGLLEEDVRRVLLAKKALVSILHGNNDPNMIESFDVLELVDRISEKSVRLDKSADSFRLHNRRMNKSRDIADFRMIWAQHVVEYFDAQVMLGIGNNEINPEGLLKDSLLLYEEGLSIYKNVTSILPELRAMNDFLQGDLLNRGIWFSGRDGIPLLMAVKASWFGADYGSRKEYESVILRQIEGNKDLENILLGLATKHRSESGASLDLPDEALLVEGINLYMQQEARFYNFVNIALVSRLLLSNVRDEAHRRNLKKYIHTLGINKHMLAVDTGYSGTVIRWLQTEMFGMEDMDRVALLKSNYASDPKGIRQILNPSDFPNSKAVLVVESFPKPFDRTILVDSNGIPFKLDTPMDLATLSWVVDHAMIRNFAPRDLDSDDGQRELDVRIEIQDVVETTQIDQVKGKLDVDITERIFDSYLLSKDLAAPAIIEFIDHELVIFAENNRNSFLYFVGEESYTLYSTAVGLLRKFPERYPGISPDSIIFGRRNSSNKNFPEPSEILKKIKEVTLRHKRGEDSPISYVHFVESSSSQQSKLMAFLLKRRGIKVMRKSEFLKKGTVDDHIRKKIEDSFLEPIDTNRVESKQREADISYLIRKYSSLGIRETVESLKQPPNAKNLSVEPDWYKYYGF